jgi:hypothetical protein
MEAQRTAVLAACASPSSLDELRALLAGGADPGRVANCACGCAAAAGVDPASPPQAAIADAHGAGRWPVHTAAEAGNAPALVALLAAGACPGVLDGLDQSAADVARARLLAAPFRDADRWQACVTALEAAAEAAAAAARRLAQGAAAATPTAGAASVPPQPAAPPCALAAWEASCGVPPAPSAATLPAGRESAGAAASPDVAPGVVWVAPSGTRSHVRALTTLGGGRGALPHAVAQYPRAEQWPPTWRNNHGRHESLRRQQQLSLCGPSGRPQSTVAGAVDASYVASAGELAAAPARLARGDTVLSLSDDDDAASGCCGGAHSARRSLAPSGWDCGSSSTDDDDDDECERASLRSSPAPDVDDGGLPSAGGSSAGTGYHRPGVRSLSRVDARVVSPQQQQQQRHGQDGSGALSSPPPFSPRAGDSGGYSRGAALAPVTASTAYASSKRPPTPLTDALWLVENAHTPTAAQSAFGTPRGGLPPRYAAAAAAAAAGPGDAVTPVPASPAVTVLYRRSPVGGGSGGCGGATGLYTPLGSGTTVTDAATATTTATPVGWPLRSQQPHGRAGSTAFFFYSPRGAPVTPAAPPPASDVTRASPPGALSASAAVDSGEWPVQPPTLPIDAAAASSTFDGAATNPVALAVGPLPQSAYHAQLALARARADAAQAGGGGGNNGAAAALHHRLRRRLSSRLSQSSTTAGGSGGRRGGAVGAPPRPDLCVSTADGSSAAGYYGGGPFAGGDTPALATHASSSHAPFLTARGGDNDDYDGGAASGGVFFRFVTARSASGGGGCGGGGCTAYCADGDDDGCDVAGVGSPAPLHRAYAHGVRSLSRGASPPHGWALPPPQPSRQPTPPPLMQPFQLPQPTGAYHHHAAGGVGGGLSQASSATLQLAPLPLPPPASYDRLRRLPHFHRPESDSASADAVPAPPPPPLPGGRHGCNGGHRDERPDGGWHPRYGSSHEEDATARQHAPVAGVYPATTTTAAAAAASSWRRRLLAGAERAFLATCPCVLGPPLPPPPPPSAAPAAAEGHAATAGADWQ